MTVDECCKYLLSRLDPGDEVKFGLMLEISNPAFVRKDGTPETMRAMCMMRGKDVPYGRDAIEPVLDQMLDTVGAKRKETV